MKRWFVACIYLAAIPVYAEELKGNVLVATNYVWRGFSLSEDAPAVLGGIDYRHADGHFASGQAATVRVNGNPEQQVVLRAALVAHHGDWTFDAGLVGYEYVRGDFYNPDTGSLAPGTANNDDFFEAFVGASLGHGEFRYYRSENYLGSGQLSNYYELHYAAPLADGARLLLHYGFTDSNAIIDHSSQLSDSAFGIAKGPFAFVVANLDDHEDGLQSRNARFIVSWQQSIDL